MKLNIFDNNYKNTAVASKAYKPKTSNYRYSPIKNIPENKCACCGNKMIISAALTHLWARITLPINQLFSNKYFDLLKEKHPEIHKVLKYFAETYPDKSFDSIVLDEDNHSLFMNSVKEAVIKEDGDLSPDGVAYGKAIKRKTSEIYSAFETKLKDSHEVMEELKPFKKYIHGANATIFRVFQILATLHPDKKIHELVQMPEVAEHHITRAYKDAMYFAKERDLHWNNADTLILENNSNLKPQLDKLHTQVALVYNDGEPKRTAYLIQKLYKDFLANNDLTNIEQPVIEEISQMPVREWTKNIYLSVARNNYSDGAIIRYIMSPFTEGEKTLIGPNEGGTNELDNKIIMCRKCCDDIGNLPFSEYSMYNPQMVQNIKDQINLYEMKILDGSIDFKYRNYPIEVAKTLSTFSDGIIQLDLVEYIRRIREMENSKGFKNIHDEY